MEKEINHVRLDGILETFQILGSNKDNITAWASVVTIHPKSGVGASKASASERFDLIHHDIRVLGRNSDREKFECLSASLDAIKGTPELFPCSVDGILSSEGMDTFVVCRVDDLKRADLVKTNDNNKVEFSGTVSSVSESEGHALVNVVSGSGKIEVRSFIPRGGEGWDMVHAGKLKKGDSVSLSGPLLTSQFTDAKKTLRVAMVTPHQMKKLELTRRVGKGGPSIG